MATGRTITERIQEAWVNPELDKVKAEVKASLEELKNKPDKTDLVAGILERGKRGLRADLNELKIADSEWPNLETAFERRFKVATTGQEKEAILRSLEAQKLDAFVNDYAKYAGLEAVIAESEKRNSKDPLKRFVRRIQGATPLFAGIGAGIMSWLKGNEAKREASGQLETAAARADAALVGDQGKRTDQQKKDSSTPTGSTGTGTSGTGTTSGSGGRAPSAGSTGRGASLDIPGAGGSRTVNVEVSGKGPSYALPDKYKVKAKSLREFQRTLLEITDRHLRNAYIAFQVAAGFVPPSFRNMHTITVNGTKEDGTPTVLTFDVSKTGLRVGLDGADRKGQPRSMEVSLDGPTAQVAVNALGYQLIRPEMERMIFDQAKREGGALILRGGQEIARADNQPERSFGAYMLGPEALLTVNRLRRNDMQEQGLNYDRLIAGHFKSVVEPTTAGIIDIRGGADINGNTIQHRTTFHQDAMASYNDAPQGVRAFDPGSIKVDGKPMTYEELMKNPELRKAFGFKEDTVGPYAIPQDLQVAVKQPAKAPAKTS